MATTILTVKRTIIDLGKDVDAYTANELGADGKFINYLSGQGMADAIGLDHTTTVQKRVSKELKALLGETFTTVQGQYKNSQNSISKINLWKTSDATKYYYYHSTQGNKLAQEIMLALAFESLDRIINDSFDRDYHKGEAEKRVANRLKGILTRRTMTDSTKDWCIRNDKPQKVTGYCVYCSEAVNVYMFGHKSKEEKQKRGCPESAKLRDYLTSDELYAIDQIEDRVVQLVDHEKMKPTDAVQLVIARMLR